MILRGAFVLEIGDTVKIPPRKLWFSDITEEGLKYAYTSDGKCSVMDFPEKYFLPLNNFGIEPGIYHDLDHVSLLVDGSNDLITHFPVKEILGYNNNSFVRLDYSSIELERNMYSTVRISDLPESVKFFPGDKVTTIIKRTTIFDGYVERFTVMEESQGRILYHLKSDPVHSYLGRDLILKKAGRIRVALEKPDDLVLKDSIHECAFWSQNYFSYNSEPKACAVGREHLPAAVREMGKDIKNGFVGFQVRGGVFICEPRKLHPQFSHLEKRVREASRKAGTLG